LAIVNPHVLRARWGESKPDSRGAVFENMKVGPGNLGWSFGPSQRTDWYRHPLLMAIWPGRVSTSMTLTLLNRKINGYPPRF